MKLFKKAFWVPYPDSDQYPTVSKAMEAITGRTAPSAVRPAGSPARIG